MERLNNKLINNGKIGLLFWFLTCFFGSVVIIAVERYFFNGVDGFYISISDAFLLISILTMIVLFSSSPLIFLIYFLSTRLQNLAQIVVTVMLFSGLITYLVVFKLCASYFEALYITGAYFVFAFLFGYVYLKIEFLEADSRSNAE